MSTAMDRNDLLARIEGVDPLTRYGKVSRIVGLVIEAVGPPDVAIGELCPLGCPGAGGIQAEVVGFRDRRVLLMPLGDIEGIRPGTEVFPTGSPLRIPVGDCLKGRILDGLGRPIDEGGEIHTQESRPVHSAPPHPLDRIRVTEALGTGVRAIDGLVTCGKGQRKPPGKFVARALRRSDGVCVAASKILPRTCSLLRLERLAAISACWKVSGKQRASSCSAS